MTTYKIQRKKLTEMRIEREKLRHPEWYNEKKLTNEDETNNSVIRHEFD